MLRYADGGRCRVQWLITAAAEQAQPDDPPAAPLQAAVAAMHRCIGFEHPETTFAHLDLPRWGFDGDTADRAVDILLGEPAEVALRADAANRYQCYERVLTFDTSNGRTVAAQHL